MALGEFALEHDNVHARAIDRYAEDLEPVVTEDRERIGIARLLDENDVARSREAAADEVERLGDAGRQHQRVGVHGAARGLAEEVGERRAEAHIALSLAVVQLERLGGGEETRAGRAEKRERQQVRRRLTDAEINRAVLRRAVEDGLAAHTAGSTSRNTLSGRPSRNSRIFEAEMRRRSSRADSE